MLFHKKERPFLPLIGNYSESPVSLDGIDILVVVVVHGFLHGDKNAKKQWKLLDLIQHFSPTCTRWKNALKFGKTLYIPLSEYEACKTDYISVKEKAIYYDWHGGTKDADDEAAWLKLRLEEGWKVFASHWLCFSGDDIDLRYENNSCYLPCPCFNTQNVSIPMMLIRHYEQMLEVHRGFLRILLMIDHRKNAQKYLSDVIEGSMVRKDVLQKIYTLLKMSEYCIHLRAVKKLSAFDRFNEDPGTKLKLPSLGTMNSIQIEKIYFNDRNLASHARSLETQLPHGGKKNRGHDVRISYGYICELVVRLRNFYLGHGILSEEDAIRLLPSLAAITKHIIMVFNESVYPEEGDTIPSPIRSVTVPAVRIFKGKDYYFSGYFCENDVWYVDYYCFEEGYQIRYEISDPTEPVWIEVRTDRGNADIVPEAAPIPVLQNRNDHNHKKIQRFLRRHQLATALFMMTGNVEERKRMWTKVFPPEPLIVSPFELKSPEYYGEDISMEELHKALLMMKCPQCIWMIDVNVWNDLYGGNDNPEKAAFSDIIELSSFLPASRIMVAVIGMQNGKISNPYPWINQFDIQAFPTIEEFSIWKSGNDQPWGVGAVSYFMAYMVQNSKLSNKLGRMAMSPVTQVYNERQEIFEYCLRVFCMKSLLTSLNNVYMAGLLKNAIDRRDYEASTIALTNFAEFTTLSVLYYLVGKYYNHMDLPEGLQRDHLVDIGEGISVLANNTREEHLKNLQGKRLKVTNYLADLQKRCQKYFPVKFEGDEICYEMTMIILRFLRNRTRGHGVVQPQSGADMWELTFIYTMALVAFLDLPSFVLFINDGYVYAGYVGEEYYYRLDKNFVVQNGVPCPRYNDYKGKPSFINYFEGERIIDSIETIHMPKTE